MQRPSVDLPQPDSPTRPSVSPRRTSRLTPSTAWTRATSRWNRMPFLTGKYLRDVAAPRRSASPFCSLTPSPRSARGWIVVSRRADFAAGSRWQASRWPRRRARSSSSGTSLHCSNRVRAARARRRTPRAAWISDGGTPGIAVSRCGSRPVEARDRAEQPPGVRVLRRREERRASCPARRPGPRTSRTTRSATSATTPMSCVIMHDRRAELVLELADQLEDLRLDRHVERRRRLVGDQEVGVARERHRDHHALAHAARELVRIVVDAHARVGDADRLEQLDRARVGGLLRRSSSCARICSAICQPTR